MTKRRLSPEEKDFCTSQIKRLEKENTDLEYLAKYTTLILEEGLDYSYRKQKREHAENLQKIREDTQINNEKIRTLKEQATKGVEPKKPSQGEQPCQTQPSSEPPQK